MTKSWDEMRKAKEDEYFNKLNSEALAALKQRRAERQARKSPITGKEMEQVAFHGVIIDRCNDTGGVWLDAGELEQLLEIAGSNSTKEEQNSLIASFFKGITGKR